MIRLLHMASTDLQFTKPVNDKWALTFSFMNIHVSSNHFEKLYILKRKSFATLTKMLFPSF